MNLQNGYKVIYDRAIGGEHVFCASKTGAFADAEEILRVAAGEYRLVYEKDGCFYGSTTGIPAEGDHCFVELNKVFVAEVADEAVEAPIAEPAAESTKEEPEVTNETTTEDPVVGETEE